MGREAEHGFVQQLTQTAHGMPQARHETRWVHWFRIREDIVAVLVIDTGMNVHAAAGQLTKRFGHESGAVTVFSCNAFHNAPEQERVSAGDHCVGLMKVLISHCPGENSPCSVVNGTPCNSLAILTSFKKASQSNRASAIQY